MKHQGTMQKDGKVQSVTPHNQGSGGWYIRSEKVRLGQGRSKQWPLAPNSRDSHVTRANLSRGVTFFSKTAFGECCRVWRVRATRLGKCRQVWRVTTSTQNAPKNASASTRDICKICTRQICCRVAIAQLGQQVDIIIFLV